MPNTFIDDIESITDEVSSWGAEIIREVVESLAPDGRGYGQDKIPLDEQLNRYRQIRNNPDAWQIWIQTKATELQNTLTNSGVSPDTIGSINPIAIATAYAVDYSSKMEAELAKRMI